MAQYTAATAAIHLFPKLKTGFHQQAERMTRGMTAEIRVTPKLDRMVTSKMAPIPVQVQPNIDNAALARIERALRALPSIEVDADTGAAQAKVQELRARLESLRDKVVNLEVSDGQARAEIALLQRELDGIDRMDPTVDVQVDAAAASGALREVDREASRLNGRRVNVNVDVDAAGAVAGLAAVRAASSAVGGSSSAAAAPTAGLGLAMKALLIGAAVAPAIGAVSAAVAALPAAITVGGGAIGAIALGMDGIKRAAETAKPALDQMKASVSSSFEASLVPAMQGIAQMLPQLTGGFKQIATALGGTATQVVNWLNSAEVIGQINGLLTGTTSVIQAMQPAVMALVSNFIQLADSGLENFMMPLAGHLSSAAQGFGQMIAHAQGTGALQGALEGLADTFGVLLTFLNDLIGAGLQSWSVLAGPVNTAFALLGQVIVALMPALTSLTQVFLSVLNPVLAALVPIVVALTPAFTQLADMLAGLLGGALTEVTPLLASVAQMLGGVLQQALSALAPLIPTIVSAVTLLANALMPLVPILGQVASTLISALAPVIPVLAGAFGQLVGILAPVVGTVVQFAGALLSGLAPVLAQLIATLLPPLMDIISSLMPLVASLAGAFMQVVMALMPLVPPIMRLAQALLPPLAALFGVIAGVVSTVLVPIITFLANVLATVLTWAITNVVLPALNMLGPIFQSIGAIAIWLWTSAIQPAWTAISAAAMWLWTNAIQPAFNLISTIFKYIGAIVFTVLVAPLLAAWNLVSAAAMWLWTNAIQPAFNAIGTFIGWVWTTLIKPALDAMVWLWQNVLAPALSWLWTTIIQPIFNLIGTFIAWVWTTLIKPALDAMVWLWQGVLAPAAMWLWNNVIKPAFEGIGNIISWVWNNVIRPAFDAVKQGLQWLGEKFDQVTNWIGDIWAKIRGFLAKPINFMINTVWNEGVVPAWNKVADLVGIGKIDRLNPIPEARTGGRVDSRGMIRGPGNGTSDSILGRVKENDAPLKVSNREFIVNARATRRHLPLLTALNGGATIGDRGNERRSRGIPAFAGGGPVWQGLWNTVRAQFPNARLTDAVRSSGGGYHQKGQAIDVAGSYPMAVKQMIDINKWIGKTFPGSTQLIHYPIVGGGINLLNGGPHMYNTATQATHANHVHWAQDPANPRGGGNGGTVWGAVSTYFMDKAREAFDGFTNPAIDGLKAWIGAPPPRWREVVPALATKMRDTVRDFVFGKAAEKDAEASAAGGGAMMGPVGDGEIFVIQQIADSARARGLGFDGAAIGVATGIVESGLRNLNYGDRDSLGVFQQRPSMGWGSPAQIMNVRYAADKFFNGLMAFNWRAMDPGQAAQKVQRSAFPAKYGQVMPRARQLTAQHGGAFDWGGLALGKGLMFKDVIAPERVLDPVQTRDYDTLSRAVRALDVGQAAARSAESATNTERVGATVNQNFYGPINDPVDVDMIGQRTEFQISTGSL